jgi:Fe-S-cluster containining protein
MGEAASLEAGDFGDWVTGMRSALRGGGESDVPCGTCTACCRASQFVHVDPDEQDALDHIPAELLFPAPGLPAGHRVMGYDANGCCPMLRDGRCSIYAHRPRACRTYDCRIFAATGLEPDGSGQVVVAERVRRWEFSFATAADRETFDRLHAAAAASPRPSAIQRAVDAVATAAGDLT